MKIMGQMIGEQTEVRRSGDGDDSGRSDGDDEGGRTR